MAEPTILCLIPARSGSKGIPHKNIQEFRGKPLMAWSIEQAQQCKYKMRVIVSTDDMNYADVARAHGAEVPFLRPKEISQDLSTDYEFISHALDWLAKYDNYVPDVVVQLRPTYPTRTVALLNDCLETFLANRSTFDSLRTVVPIEKSPYKMYRIDQGRLRPVCQSWEGRREPHNLCRQELPQCYLHNGCIDILRAEIVKYGTISGQMIYPYVMAAEETHDIDTVADLDAAKEQVTN